MGIATFPAVLLGGGLWGSSAETHTIIALTEDWTVHAFDHTLRPLWQHSAALTLEPESVQIEASDQPIDEAHHGGRASQSSVSFAEAVVIISPQPIYGGDRGFVFIGGRHAPSHSVRSLSARSHLARSHLAAAPLDEDPVDEGAGGRLRASSAPTHRATSSTTPPTSTLSCSRAVRVAHVGSIAPPTLSSRCVAMRR